MAGDRKKRSARPSTSEPIRLQKALSQAKVASRRAAEEMIQAGRVSVNGKVVTTLGTKVTPGDVIRVDGRRIQITQTFHYILVHKPPSMLTTLSDPMDRPKVVDLIPPRFGRVFPVGRLDWDSEGVLLLTDDGDLAWKLTHPSFGVERVYAVKVKGMVQDQDPRLAAIQAGVRLEDGTVALVRYARQTGRTKKNTWIEIALSEGRNREIRRICESVGFEIARLVRVAYGPLTLEGLPRGKWRSLTQAEVHDLKTSLTAPDRPASDRSSPNRADERRGGSS